MRLDKPDRARGIYNKIVYFCLQLSQKIVTIYTLSVRSVNSSLNYSFLIGPPRTSARFLAKPATIDHQSDERFPFLIEFHISATLNRNAFEILRRKK